MRGKAASGTCSCRQTLHCLPRWLSSHMCQFSALVLLALLDWTGLRVQRVVSSLSEEEEEKEEGEGEGEGEEEGGE